MFDNLIYFIQNPIQFLCYAPVLLFSFSVHEWGHAFAAHKNGDNTAKAMGRLTINPLAHFDIIGFICLLTWGFGWGKPVPITPRNFNNYKKGMLWVSFAGVLCNLALLLLSVLLYVLAVFLLPTLLYNEILTTIFINLVRINLVLFVFNLIPIPPLDGSKIIETLFARWIPQSYRNFMYSYGRIVMIVLLLLLVRLGAFNFIFDFAQNVVWTGVLRLLHAVLRI